MDLSIIIVNYRGWTRLKECLDALASFSAGLMSHEVIIVDNNSSDGVLNEFKKAYPGFIFIVNKINGGFGNGCNLGAGIARGDYYLFLNPDTVASEREVRKLLDRAVEYPGNFITSCRQEDERGKESKAYGLFPGFGTLTGPGRSIYRFLNKKKLNQNPGFSPPLGESGHLSPDWVSGSVMLIRRDIFQSLGGFDEDFWMYFEDMDICRRARERNGEISFYTDITIRHDHGGSSRINLRTTALTKTEVLISNHLYISKHEKGLKRILLQSILVFNNLVSGVLTALAGVICFASPKMFSKAIIFGRLIGYYSGAILKGSWISPRSVNYK
jgi:GT2 family glycosyltransferase